jgi:hypothetical protein
MVDHLNRNSAGLRLWKRARNVAVERRPGVGVDFGFQRSFEVIVGIISAEKVGVPDEKTLLAVVRVDEPARDLVGPGARNFAVT